MSAYITEEDVDINFTNDLANIALSSLGFEIEIELKILKSHKENGASKACATCEMLSDKAIDLINLIVNQLDDASIGYSIDEYLYAGYMDDMLSDLQLKLPDIIDDGCDDEKSEETLYNFLEDYVINNSDKLEELYTTLGYALCKYLSFIKLKTAISNNNITLDKKLKDRSIPLIKKISEDADMVYYTSYMTMV